MGKVLVVYYSRSGNTRRVAEAMARAAGWDTEAIRERRSRAGLWGYLRSSYEATVARTVAIEPLEHDPSHYDLVVIGTPVWNASLSSPVRTFLTQHRRSLPDVAFFATCGGRGAERVFQQMASLAPDEPRVIMALTARDLARDDLAERIRHFTEAIEHSLPGYGPPHPQPPAAHH